MLLKHTIKVWKISFPYVERIVCGLSSGDAPHEGLQNLKFMGAAGGKEYGGGLRRSRILRLDLFCGSAKLRSVDPIGRPVPDTMLHTGTQAPRSHQLTTSPLAGGQSHSKSKRTL